MFQNHAQLLLSAATITLSKNRVLLVKKSVFSVIDERVVWPSCISYAPFMHVNELFQMTFEAKIRDFWQKFQCNQSKKFQQKFEEKKIVTKMRFELWNLLNLLGSRIEHNLIKFENFGKFCLISYKWKCLRKV